MTIQTITLSGKRFVLLPEADYLKLTGKSVAKTNGTKINGAKAKPAKRRLTAQDRGDIAEAHRRRHESARPYSELRKELGLV